MRGRPPRKEINMEQPQSRYHGKVRVQTGDTVIEINVFDDNQEKVYQEVQKAIAQFSPDIKPATTAAQSASPRAEQARAAAAPSPVPKQGASVPTCRDCGEECKLIRWTDKGSHQAMSRYKCPHCGTWAPR
jgi:predicted RNA-binding Zn-ribbon protein involved in translation (DUF1610 family)